MEYKILHRIGQGAYGVVVKAKKLDTGELVAMKQLPIRREKGEILSQSVLREIKALQIVQHENIVPLLQVTSSQTMLNLVFPYMPTDLSQLLNSEIQIPVPLVKRYLLQLLAGTSYLHSKKIMHRDLKPANLLIAFNGMLKIADFGLARIEWRLVLPSQTSLPQQPSTVAPSSTFTSLSMLPIPSLSTPFLSTPSTQSREQSFGLESPLPLYESCTLDASPNDDTPNDTPKANSSSCYYEYSHQICTRWYRPPELLYGSRTYDSSVDVWSIGCIFGEMLNHSPLFPGNSDIDQLAVVVAAIGSCEGTSHASLPDYSKILFPPTPPKPWTEICPLPRATDSARDLLGQFLQSEGVNRIQAKTAQSHGYFFEHPHPREKADVPRPGRRDWVWKVEVEADDAAFDGDFGGWEREGWAWMVSAD